jgi:hypothetical protein
LNLIAKILVGALVLLAGAACNNSNDCYEPIDVSARWNFKTERMMIRKVDSGTANERDTMIFEFYDTALFNVRATMLDVSQNITFYDQNGSVYPLLNPDTNVQRYAIQFDSAQVGFDTFTLFYNTNLHFISNACGYTFFYNIDSISTTRHVIDSFWINDAAVTNEAGKVNLSLFFIKP